jgi:hypothetical protein
MTELENRLWDVGHDCRVIQSEVGRKDFQSALDGLDWVIKELGELRTGLAEAVTAHETHRVKSGLEQGI